MNTEQNLPIFLLRKFFMNVFKWHLKVKQHVFVVAQFLFGKSLKCTW